MVWRLEDPQGNEAAKVKYDIVPYTRGRGLDLGCGPYKAFDHFTGVDNHDHRKKFGWQFEADVYVESCEKLDIFSDKSMDFVFSSHLLEHIENFEDALREWWRVIKVGGHLVLYLPHKKFYPNIGQPGANPDHKHDFEPNDIADAMRRVASGESGWDLVENEDRNEGREYSFFQVYRKRRDGQCRELKYQWKKPGSKMVCVVRYGGFGDMIQASSLFPALKADGWHITVMTTPKGADILKADPHVDQFLLQDGNPNPDQVPNAELGAYWNVWQQKFDRWINLSESVESTLLAIPGRTNHRWPKELRHQVLNQNYLEFTHAIAEVPMPPRPEFYPTDEENEWAAQELLPIQGFLVMIVLAGSSVHKAYPHMDNVIGRILKCIPEATVVLTGDVGCQVLEAGWQGNPRVLRRCGLWSIRQTMTAARECDLVIGPETGVMNAVAFRKNAKIVMLSHSSVENLTRDWVNTTSLLPSQQVKCYPCHQMHYTREFCPQWWVPVKNHPIAEDPLLVKQMEEQGHIVANMFATGAALCAASISPDDVCGEVERIYESWRTYRNLPAPG